MKLSDREVLDHAGAISHADAVAKATLEYERYDAEQRSLPSAAEQHFDAALRNVKAIEQKRKKGRKKREA